jgi:hypothetical protein
MGGYKIRTIINATNGGNVVVVVVVVVVAVIIAAIELWYGNYVGKYIV